MRHHTEWENAAALRGLERMKSQYSYTKINSNIVPYIWFGGRFNLLAKEGDQMDSLNLWQA